MKNHRTMKQVKHVGHHISVTVIKHKKRVLCLGGCGKMVFEEIMTCTKCKKAALHRKAEAEYKARKRRGGKQ
jgi:hypothetical protein